MAARIPFRLVVHLLAGKSAPTRSSSLPLPYE